MARTSDITDFLTDVSAAIKQKIGDNTPIVASQFDTKILSIPTNANNIRLYNSTTERDTDTPVEGLIGVVYNNPFTNATLGASTYGLYFKKRVVLTTPVTLTNFSFMGIVLSGQVTIDSTSAIFTLNRITSQGTKVYTISYTSEDGLTYIRTPESRTIIGQSPQMSSTIQNQNTFPEIVNFLGINSDSSIASTPQITFGVYKYENGGWAYIDIKDITPIASEIMKQTDGYYYINGNKAYTNDGFVTGTYEDSGGGSGDVKLFETEQAMQADPDAQDDDLAIIYRSSVTGITETSEFDKCVFPQTVVLSEAYTGSLFGMFMDNESMGYFNGNVELDSSRFEFTGWRRIWVNLDKLYFFRWNNLYSNRWWRRNYRFWIYYQMGKLWRPLG